MDGLNDQESNLADWITVPKYNSFPTEFNRKIHIKLAKWMRSILQKIIYFGNVNRLKKINPDIIFVNSLGGDILYNRYKIKNLRSKSIMILRGSPNTFTLGHDKSFDIDNIVKELEKYHKNFAYKKKNKCILIHKGLTSALDYFYRFLYNNITI